MNSSVVQANIDLHTVLPTATTSRAALSRREQDRVRAKIQELQKRCSGTRLLDLGCGTGS